MVEGSGVGLLALLGWLPHVRHEVADMSQWDACASSASTRWLDTFPQVIHPADVVKGPRDRWHGVVELRLALLILLGLLGLPLQL